MFVRYLHESCQEAFREWYLAVRCACRFEDYAGDLAGLLGEDALDLSKVGRSDDYAFERGLRHPHRRGHVEWRLEARGHRIRPAVEVALELEELLSAREGASEAHRHHGRLGA